MFYNIAASINTKGTLFVSKEFIKKYNNLYENMELRVVAGGKDFMVSLFTSDTLPNNYIRISSDVLDFLSIPIDIQYQINVNKDTLILGPIIGLLLCKIQPTIENDLDEFLVYTLLYNEFKGLIYIFSPEGVDYNAGLIEGYYFKPDLDNETILWKKRKLPYPSAIYRRISLSSNENKAIMKICDNKLFNSSFFNKLTFYKIASALQNTRNHTPNTLKVNNFQNIDDMLKKHPSVFLKPIDGSRALGLINIEKSDTRYIFRKNLDVDTVILDTSESAEEYFNAIKCKSRYLVQQGIDCIKIENRCIDFRVIMQKNNSLRWQCTGIIARVGMENGISSTYKAHGYALTFEELFYRLKLLNEKEIFKLKQRLINTCLEFCFALDSTEEHYGDLGIDAMIDKDFKVWIIEINKRHDHVVPISINDRQMYYSVKSNPIKYAVGLSGFSI